MFALKGKSLIDSAIGTFKRAAQDIETGIQQLQSEATNRQATIDTHTARIVEINGQIGEATNVLTNIKKIYQP